MSRVLPEPTSFKFKWASPANDLSRFVLVCFFFFLILISLSLSLHYFHQNVRLLLLNVVCACFLLFLVSVHHLHLYIHQRLHIIQVTQYRTCLGREERVLQFDHILDIRCTLCGNERPSHCHHSSMTLPSQSEVPDKLYRTIGSA
jgi:hypothetical protein